MAKSTTTAAPTAAKPVRILSLDGGGIRGILAGQLLVALERELQALSGRASARIADYVDLVAGTSTGGILACALLAPDAQGRPRYSAEQVVGFYLERGDEIFSVGFWKKLSSGGGLNDEKYPAAELESALRDYFGDLRLKDLLKPCVITAYDIERRQVHLFTQHDARTDPAYDFAVRDVARATSAAPTYFEPPRIRSATNVRYPLIDGGLFANNPTLVAYSEARQMDFPGRAAKPTAKDLAILSLGTGPTGEGSRKVYDWDEAKDWGKVGWAPAVIDILMTAAEDVTAFHMKMIYDTLGPGMQHRYLRLHPVLGKADEAMDNASRANLLALKAAGEESARLHGPAIKAYAKLLVDAA